jgi:ATP-dependent DNA ligase
VPWADGRCGGLAVAQGHSSADLRFAGIVEAGFSEADRVELGRRLGPIQVAGAGPWRTHRGKPVYAVAPKVSVEVQLLEWTEQGRARHLSYKGLPLS